MFESCESANFSCFDKFDNETKWYACMTMTKTVHVDDIVVFNFLSIFADALVNVGTVTTDSEPVADYKSTMSFIAKLWPTPSSLLTFSP